MEETVNDNLSIGKCMLNMKNPNTISEIRTRDPQIVRAAAIPLVH